MSHALLSRLKSGGAVVEVIKGKLRIEAPEDLLTENLLAELKANKDSIIQELKLVDYHQRGRAARSLAELFAVLKDFSQHKWTLCQQSDMSAAYTSIALRLIESEQADKWEVLEDLAFLCWKGSAT